MAGNRTSDPLITSPTPNQLSYFVPIGDRSGDECSGKLYEASGAGRNTAQRLGKYRRRMDPCAKLEAGTRIHVSEGMVRDVTVMKYEENG